MGEAGRSIPVIRGSPVELDCGLRRNDGGVGAIHRAPTKNYPCQPYTPRCGGGTWILAHVGVMGGDLATGR